MNMYLFFMSESTPLMMKVIYVAIAVSTMCDL